MAVIEELTTESSCGTIHLLVEEGKLIYCGFSPWDAPGTRLPRLLRNHITDEAESELRPWPRPVEGASQLGEAIHTYFENVLAERKADPPPMRFYGTSFQQAVWRALLLVPAGSLVTYGQVAESVGRPGAVRAVGSAVGTNPFAPVVPCHRVVPSAGGIGNYGGGAALKRQLLAMEGALETA